MTQLTVGTGQQFNTLSAAVAAARDGDELLVKAGTYVNDFADINTKLTLKAVGGIVHLQATVPPPNGKAILTTSTDVTIQGFEFSGAAVRDLNGAGIRQQGGNLRIEDCWFHHNQMGILTTSDPKATLTIRDTEFNNNIAAGPTAASGLTHNLYVNQIGKLTIENSYFHDAALGHNIKSRAAETVISNSRIADFGSTGSYSIDLPNGGKALLAGNVIQQGQNSGNPAIVAFGEEGGVYSGSSIEMRGNTVVNDLSGGTLLWNAAGAPASVTGTSAFGLGTSNFVSGPATVSGTTFLTSRPAVDTAHPWEVTPVAGPTPNPAPSPSPTPAPVPTPAPAGQVLNGTAGSDRITGGAGNDTITGGFGADTLTGGGGADLFVWNSIRDRGDHVRDFQPVTQGDKLDLTGVYGSTPHPHDQAGLLEAGFLRFIEKGANVGVYVDLNRGGDFFIHLVWLNGTKIADLGNNALIA